MEEDKEGTIKFYKLNIVTGPFNCRNSSVWKKKKKKKKQ